MIRIVLADDHTIVREGLKQLLCAAAEFQVVGEARDGHEVMKQVRENDFDVLLLATNFHLSAQDGGGCPTHSRRRSSAA